MCARRWAVHQQGRGIVTACPGLALHGAEANVLVPKVFSAARQTSAEERKVRFVLPGRHRDGGVPDDEHPLVGGLGSDCHGHARHFSPVQHIHPEGVLHAELVSIPRPNYGAAGETDQRHLPGLGLQAQLRRAAVCREYSRLAHIHMQSRLRVVHHGHDDAPLNARLGGAHRLPPCTIVKAESVPHQPENAPLSRITPEGRVRERADHEHPLLACSGCELLHARNLIPISWIRSRRHGLYSHHRVAARGGDLLARENQCRELANVVAGAELLWSAKRVLYLQVWCTRQVEPRHLRALQWPPCMRHMMERRTK
mmetsp:Transcript_60585/g.131319  ORF Transcript_60585/g.131319 Transcript_60585/m.131319 type:complete len:312 (-) Transcript_60585:791-1726(-)